jgi:hypothetical protein
MFSEEGQMRSRIVMTMGAILLLGSCGTADTTTTAGAGDTTVPEVEEVTTVVGATSTTGAPEAEAGDDPCSLVTAEVVAAAFGASSASLEPGGGCSFTIVDGVAPGVGVLDYGSSSQWDGVKSGFEENRGGVTEVPGIGDEAFYPNDVGPSYELVVRSGDVIFEVLVLTGSGGPEVEAAIQELARTIAGG